MASTSVTIVVELDPAVEVPAGSARLPEGTARPFYGWLGLAEAIDSLAGLSARSDAMSIFGATTAPGGSTDGKPEGSAS